ncbi:MAG: hypothetical protein KIT72_12280 [Polyangiaceae bacterium]|nr:hypothetical protein [Polyangiaceae bacterium]MCW5791191.1 hypothetical protein [Polyangiaceae bacterium]
MKHPLTSPLGKTLAARPRLAQRSWGRRLACLLALSVGVLAPLQAAVAQPAPEEPVELEEAAEPDAPSEPTPEPAPAAPEPAPLPEKETNCTDRIDNDGDSLVDCADADCYDLPVCQPTGQRESTNALCSDWIDNDGDGVMDCDDSDCFAPGITVCKGSAGSRAGARDPLPIGSGLNVEELIGQGSDRDGERNDVLCSDGFDNDGDGKVDCEDFGCRFDPSVTVCGGNPGLNFSVVAQLTQSYLFEDTRDNGLESDRWDTRFSLLQLRAMGPIRGIQDSFFLVSMRAERTPRVTFAMFQMPINSDGHYVNINSGGGGLSSQLIISASKHLLVEPAYYMFSAFEQGNGAAIEVGGPLSDQGTLLYRAFAAGGSGRSSGNIGGRFYSDANTNYTWAAGAQVHFNAIGYYSRFDTPFLYTPASTTLALTLGAKYDQRAQERYPAVNAGAVFKAGPIVFLGEVYGKRELEFESTQVAYNAQLGVLAVPKLLMLAADFGAYLAGDLENPPESISDLGTDVTKQRDEQQFRVAAHLYVFRNVGVLSALYKHREVKSGRQASDGFIEREGRLVAGYRF